MVRRFILIVFVGVMLFLEGFFFVTPTKSAVTTSTAIQTLQPFTGSVSSISKPPPAGQIGTDLGTNQIKFTQSNIQFSRPSGGNITIGFPSLTGLIPTKQALKNSTTIAYHFTGTIPISLVPVDISMYVRNSTNPYNRKIVMSGSLTGLVGTLPLVVPLSGLSPSVCDSLAHAGPFGTIPPCTRQCFGSMCFDWSDSAASTSYNNVTKTVTFTIGASFFLDPLALDGSNQCYDNFTGTSKSCTITTSNTNDVIIIEVWMTQATDTSLSSITDTSSLTWTSRVNCQCGLSPAGFVTEWYTVAGSALSSDTVTVHWTTNTGTEIRINIFGISGATTGNCGSGGNTCFDSNVVLPNTCSRFCGAGGLTVSTSNANDMIYATFSVPFEASDSARTGWTMPISANSFVTQYEIVSATQSSINVTPAGNCNNDGTHSCQAGLADAIQQAAATATEKVTLTISPVGAPNQGAVTISGCNPTTTSHAIDGVQFTFTADAVCTITYTVAAAATNAQDCFNSAGACSTNTFYQTTTAGGTDTKAFTVYHQLRNLYQATPVGPTIWDAAYNINVKGTYLGASTNCGGGNTIATIAGLGAASSQLWCDYNLLTTMDTPVGPWSAIPAGSNTFTQTTGGNTNNVNYTIGTGSIIVGLMALGIILAFLFLGKIFLFRKRR